MKPTVFLDKIISCYKFYKDFFLKTKIGNYFLKSTDTKEEDDDIYWLKLIYIIFYNLYTKIRARERSSSFYSSA